MAKIGFLGLGTMGLPMAKRLLAAGHELMIAVHSNPAPAAELEKLGAKRVATVAEAVAGVEFIITILPEDRQVLDVMLAAGVMLAVDRGTVIIEMSTTASATVRRLAREYVASDVKVLDAPVSGGPVGARDGTLTIMCGGEAAVLEKARPVLEPMGTNIFHVGDIGAGKDVKAVNNLTAAVNMVMVAEALQLARKLGLDPDVVQEVVGSSSGQSFNFDTRFKRAVNQGFAGGFKTWLMMKDMRIALNEAGGLSMPLAQLAYQLYQMTAPADRDLDYAAVSKIYPGNQNEGE